MVMDMNALNSFKHPSDHFFIWGMEEENKALENTYFCTPETPIVRKYSTKVPFDIKDNQLVVITSAKNLRITDRDLLTDNMVSPKAIANNVSDGLVSDFCADLETYESPGCVWETRNSLGSSDGQHAGKMPPETFENEGLEDSEPLDCVWEIINETGHSCVRAGNLRFVKRKVSENKVVSRKRKYLAHESNRTSDAGLQNGPARNVGTSKIEHAALAATQLCSSETDSPVSASLASTSINNDADNVQTFPCNLAFLNNTTDGCVWEALNESTEKLSTGATESDFCVGVSSPSKDVSGVNINGAKELIEIVEQEKINSDAVQPDTLLLDPTTLERGFENMVNSKLTKIKRRRRKSMSADQEIGNQFLGNNYLLPSNSDQSVTCRRYSHRLRRKSTELIPPSQHDLYLDFPDTSEPNRDELQSKFKDSSFTDQNAADPCPEGREVPDVAEISVSLNIQASSPKSEQLCQEGMEVSITDFISERSSKTVKRRLRRNSTELYRLSKTNQSENHSVSEKFRNGTQSSITNASKSSKCLKQKNKAAEEPTLEDIYLNKLWRTQMPKNGLWETIHEYPKYNKQMGELMYFSTRKLKRLMNFEEGPSELRLKSRKQKAMKQGWKPLTKKEDMKLNKLLQKKLSQLDKELTSCMSLDKDT